MLREYPGSLVQGSFYACIFGLHKDICGPYPLIILKGMREEA